MKRIALALAVAAALLMFPSAALASDGAEATGIAITVVVPRPEIAPQPLAPPPLPRIYPVSVHESHVNGRREIIRVYELRGRDNPARISREPFERGGYRFELAEIVRREVPVESTREHAEVFSFDTESDDLATIIGAISPTLEGMTADGYSGVLTLDISTITVESQGTRTNSRLATRTREFPHLSSPDTSLIPRTITENNRTYNLADVEWRTQTTTAVDYTQIANTFTAIATYTRTAVWTTNIGYTTTAVYRGQVSRIVEVKTEFTVQFIGIPIVIPVVEKTTQVQQIEEEKEVITTNENGYEEEVQFEEIESEESECEIEEELPQIADYDESDDEEYAVIYEDDSGNFPVRYVVMGVMFVAGIAGAYFIGKKGFGTIKKVSCMLLMIGLTLGVVQSAYAVQLPEYGFGRRDAGDAVHFDTRASVPSSQNTGVTHFETARPISTYNYGDFIGVLTVERLGRTINVIAGATMEAMDYGAGHFSFTGLNSGNTGLIGHNRGRTNGFFSFVRNLREGDILTLEAGGITRRYSVALLYSVHYTDFSPLAEFQDHRLTLVTCVEYRRNYRRIAVAIAID